MKKISGILISLLTMFLIAGSALALTASNKCPWFNTVNGICKYKIESINVGILETDTDTASSLINVPLTQPDISGATMEPGNAITVSWTPELKATDFDHYFIRYGCAATPDVQVETGTISERTKDNYVWWTIPNNLGNNCYCKVWVTIKQGTDNFSTPNLGGANSRPFYVCKDQPTQSDPDEGKTYIKGQVLAEFKSNISVASVTGKNQIATFAKANNLSVADYLPDYNTVLLQTTANETVKSLLAKLKTKTEIANIQPNYIYYPAAIPNDPRYSEQWALPKMKAPEAWDKFTGSKDIIVSIVDTGVYFDHADLKDNMWNGANCKAPDGSGKCPNHGWDFGANDNNPAPDKGTYKPNEVPRGADHGTHVAGIVGAVGNNSQLVAGANWKVSLMAVKGCKNQVADVKVKDQNGQEQTVRMDICQLSTASNIKGIDFSRENGARVINASWGGYFPKGVVDNTLLTAIKKFTAGGGLFVAGSGNNGVNMNSGPVYFVPCSYSVDNLICVAATDQNDKLAQFSNHGTQYVDIGAPGVAILSTVWEPNGGNQLLKSWDGTSMATPYVSGLAAFIWGNKPSLDASQVKQIIYDTADPASDLQGKTVHAKRINFFNAISGSSTPTTTPTITPPLAPIVVTEAGWYDEAKNTFDMSATIWVGRQTKEVQWWMKAYMKDSNGAKANEMELPAPRGKKTIVYPGGDHLVKTTATNLPKLPNNESAWCFTPYAKYTDGSGTEGFGQELCFPKVPWIITKKPTNVDAVNGKMIMNGAVTYFAKFTKVDVWFEHHYKSDPNITKTTPKPINAVSPVPAGGVLFSEPLTYTPKKDDPMCYKACGKGQGGKFITCGVEECIGTSTGTPPKDIKVTTLPFEMNGNETVYKGKIAPIFTTADCQFRVFPKSDANETASIVFQAGPPSAANGEFSHKDSSFDFKNSKYCYRAYCTLQGNTYKAENRVCADEGGTPPSTSNLFLLACGNLETCLYCRYLNDDMKKYAQEKGITMVEHVTDADFQSVVLQNKEKIKMGHMKTGENTSCNQYFAKYSPSGGIPMGVFFRDGKDIGGFMGHAKGDYDGLKSKIEGNIGTASVNNIAPTAVTVAPRQYYYPTPKGWCELTVKKYNSTSSCNADLAANPNLRATNGYPICYNHSDVCGGVAFDCMNDISKCRPSVKTGDIMSVGTTSASVYGKVTGVGMDSNVRTWLNVKKFIAIRGPGQVEEFGPQSSQTQSQSEGYWLWRYIDKLDPDSRYSYAYCAANAFGGVCNDYKYDPFIETKSVTGLFVGTMGVKELSGTKAYLPGRLYSTLDENVPSRLADVWLWAWQPRIPGACFPDDPKEVLAGTQIYNIGVTTTYVHSNYRDGMEVWADFGGYVNLKPNTNYCYQARTKQVIGYGWENSPKYQYAFGQSFSFKTPGK